MTFQQVTPSNPGNNLKNESHNLIDSSPWKTQDHRGDCCGNLVQVPMENSNLPSGMTAFLTKHSRKSPTTLCMFGVTNSPHIMTRYRMIGAKNVSRSTYFERNVELVAQAIVPLEQERLCSANTNGESGRARNAITTNGPNVKLNKAVDSGRGCRISFH